jgi:hypothetical protein
MATYATKYATLAPLPPQVPIDRLAPCYAFGAPAVLCTSAGCGVSLCSVGDGMGSSGLLERLGLPTDRLVNVIMHKVSVSMEHMTVVLLRILGACLNL